MSGRDIIVIGASSGGVDALRRLLAQLPGNLDAAVLIVLHVGAHSRLPAVLSRSSRLPISAGVDGESIRPGRIYVAPPGVHMIVEQGCIRLVRGPKENFARPAIDPLFRSAAMEFGARVVGVILTGEMDDGCAGLMAVKDCGGVAIIEDPSDAAAPSMPRSALARVRADHVCGIAEMGPLLVRETGLTRERGDDAGLQPCESDDRLRQWAETLLSVASQPALDARP